MEDRRPASNCDPYLVTSAIAKTTILNSWRGGLGMENGFGSSANKNYWTSV
jgi:glutamine synthetase